jgi:hypothetical protein
MDNVILILKNAYEKSPVELPSEDLRSELLELDQSDLAEFIVAHFDRGAFNSYIN